MTTLLEKSDQRLKHDTVAMKQWWEESQDEASCDAPPAWHEAILKERLKEWEQGNEGSQNWDEAVRALRIELDIKN